MENKEAAAHHEVGLRDGEPPDVHPLWRILHQVTQVTH